jgi:hypothetical protein
LEIIMATLDKPAARRGKRKSLRPETNGSAVLLDDTRHPDFVNGIIDEAAGPVGAFTPNPDDPITIPGIPGNIPGLPIPEIPTLPVPLNICGPLSGRYKRIWPPILQPTPVGGAAPILPTLTVWTVRVDVDRFYPQKRISIEASRLFPRKLEHVIAEVTLDKCQGFFRRRVEANITYREGDSGLIPEGKLVFEARRASGSLGYGSYQLSFLQSDGTVKKFDLTFHSPQFDDIEFEVDQVANASPVVTSYDTGSHPNRPASLALETITLDTTFRRAGFKVSMSPNASTIPIADAGANGTWSDAEMHNAMVTYWSRFADKPQWTMWVLFAARHDIGRDLGGIMFDDIGPNHRQGTAIFTDSFIVDAPAGDPNPQAWINRMIYWTAVHEMGHAFNLAHAWQKTLGSPWIPLANEENLRSFMNYPFRPPWNQHTFFSGFEFRFSDSELLFMRHAPRRFVQMGNENWFDNHGFEAPPKDPGQRFELMLRPNRDINSFDFLEPVRLELKLTNTSGSPVTVDAACIADGDHIALLVQRDGGVTRRWRPFVTHCDKPEFKPLGSGESLYASHFVGASTQGWLIDESGFYTIQAAVDIDGEIVVSNPLRIYVGPPASKTEEKLAPDYFNEDVARVLAFYGAPTLAKANDVLRKVVDEAPSNPAATQAAVALGDPAKDRFKVLEIGATNGDLQIRSLDPQLETAMASEGFALVDKAAEAARTMGHIDYRKKAESLATALAKADDKNAAVKVQKTMVETLAKRGVLASVVASSRRTLEKLQK